MQPISHLPGGYVTAPGVSEWWGGGTRCRETSSLAHGSVCKGFHSHYQRSFHPPAFTQQSRQTPAHGSAIMKEGSAIIKRAACGVSNAAGGVRSLTAPCLLLFQKPLMSYTQKNSDLESGSAAEPPVGWVFTESAPSNMEHICSGGGGERSGRDAAVWRPLPWQQLNG